MKSQEPKNQHPIRSSDPYFPLRVALALGLTITATAVLTASLALGTVARQRSQAADWATPLAKQE
jgi:hypothetical protein